MGILKLLLYTIKGNLRNALAFRVLIVACANEVP